MQGAAVVIRKDERLRLLQGVWLFSACSKGELGRIASASTPLEASPGEVLAREGEPGREFFVVVDGQAAVSIGGRTVDEIGPGSFFGEMSLLDGGPRTATVTARSPMSLLVLSKGEFDYLLDSGMPSVARKMLTAVGERLRAMDALASR
jgi:CRP/FNR family cyclic AMP-dependent transcriptional regulator